MPVILNKSKFLTPRHVKEVRYIGPIEKKTLDMAKAIAKDFGLQSKKQKPKKIIFR